MIRYFSEDISFNLANKRSNNKWIRTLVESENKKLGDLNYIFCSDEYLLDVNKNFLRHDYYTDIITFDYCEKNTVSGDLFISIDSVRDNAEHFGVSFENELSRVMAHGVLHLVGYDDHCDEDILEMRAKEDFYINLRKSLFEDAE